MEAINCLIEHINVISFACLGYVYVLKKRRVENMEQERFVVIDNKKGVLIPLSTENSEEIEKSGSVELEEKVNKLHFLIKALIKQTMKDTVKEYNLQLVEELKEYEKYETDRWNELQKREEGKWIEMQKREEEHWNALEKREEKYRENMRKEEERRWKNLEEHFEQVDKSIREKQMNKRKKGP